MYCISTGKTVFGAIILACSVPFRRTLLLNVIVSPVINLLDLDTAVITHATINDYGMSAYDDELRF